MSKNIVEELPARKHAPAAAPEAKKEGGKPEAKKGGGSVEEGSEKKIRQAVYDIRYRARREDIDLKAAYAQYMSNSSLSQAERTAVRAKLFGKEGGGVKEQFTTGADEWATDNVANALYKVFVENEENKEIELAYLQQLEEQEGGKYKVRVKDKNGKTYVRYADRAKITQLRSNPNIESVEMTDHGEPYEGERKKGTQTARSKGGGKKKLDPVGKEDADVDNDGDVDKSDKYLLKRRRAIGNAIKTRAEAFIADGTISTEAKGKKVGENKVDNYKSGAVTVAPEDKSLESSKNAARGGIYASFAHQAMLKTLAEKKALEEKKAEEKVDESTINTADCEKKPEEKEKDMRGYYAKINIIKNKIRAMGAKNPMLISDPDEVEKSWDKDKKKDDDVKEGMWTKDKGKYVDSRPERARKKYGDPKDEVDGSKERTAADPDMPRRMGKQTPPLKGKEASKTPYPGYNPQKGVGSEYKP
jgi:hypothetical protein